MSEYSGFTLKGSDTSKLGKSVCHKAILVFAYFGIWAFSVILFWLTPLRYNAMGYSILFLWILIPVTAFIISFFIGKNGYFGKFKWAAALIMGIMHMLAEYLTFSLANMVSFSKINTPRPEVFAVSALIFVLGTVIGICFNSIMSEFRSVK